VGNLPKKFCTAKTAGKKNQASAFYYPGPIFDAQAIAHQKNMHN